jgi:amidase
MDELIYASATALARAIRAKEVSSEEVVDAYLQRIQEVNPKLNAIVQLTADAARAEAREADDALARGHIRGPLHGVPVTINDNIETVGVICTGGTKGRARARARPFWVVGSVRSFKRGVSVNSGESSKIEVLES